MFGVFSTIIYITFSKEEVTVQNIRSGALASELPVVAVATSGRRKVLAIGQEAKRSLEGHQCDFIDPFSMNARSSLNDIELLAEFGSEFVKRLIKRVRASSFFRPNLVIIMHPLGIPQGELSASDRGILVQMAVLSGADKVLVANREDRLSETELLQFLNGKF